MRARLPALESVTSNPRLLTIPDAALQLGVHHSTVRRYMNKRCPLNRQRLRANRLGRQSKGVLAIDVDSLCPNAPPGWMLRTDAVGMVPESSLVRHETIKHPAIGKTLDVDWFIAMDSANGRLLRQKHYRKEEVLAIKNWEDQVFVHPIHGRVLRECQVVAKGIARGSLLVWNLKGCPKLGGKKPTRVKIPDLSGKRRRKVWGYLETEIDQILAAGDLRSRPAVEHEWQITLKGELFDSPRLASKITGLPIHAFKPHNRRDRQPFPIPSVKSPLKIKTARSPVTRKKTSVFRHKDCLDIGQLVGAKDANTSISPSVVVKNVEDVSPIAASKIVEAFKARMGRATLEREPVSKQAELPSTKKRGRPKGRTKHDPIADAKLVGRWQSSGFKTTEEFDRKEGLPIGTTRSAIDRDRMRRQPEKK